MRKLILTLNYLFIFFAYLTNVINNGKEEEQKKIKP